jgi:hypothetical protein
MNLAPFCSRAPLSKLLLRTAAVIVLSAAATAQASSDGLAISGTPATNATVGQWYSFTPTVSNPSKRPLQFHIWNRPVWANYSPTTGRLSGTPTAADLGMESHITIIVADGVDRAFLSAFTLKVSAATGSADKPVISGTPPSSVTAGNTYKFQPTAKDPGGKTLSFSVQNKPSWASFSIASGLIDGTPTVSQRGSYNNIIISASNGQYSSALPAFGVTVTATTNGAATLDWVLPSTDTKGDKLTDLAGVRIYYGTSPANLAQMVQVASATATSTTIANLAAGTWYFGSVAYTTAGVTSAMSAIVNTAIP